MVHKRSAKYGRYTGGPDPLAPPVDLAEALDAVAEDVMAGYSPRHCGAPPCAGRTRPWRGLSTSNRQWKF